MKNYEKIKALYSIIKDNWPAINAYLHSKDIYSFLVKDLFFHDEGVLEAIVESKSSDECYEVFIDLNKDIYYCTCNSFVFKKYFLDIPEKYKHLFWRKNIAICPHILKVIQHVYKIKRIPGLIS